MKSVITPNSVSRLRTAAATNSGPLSSADMLRDAVLQKELREHVEHAVLCLKGELTQRQARTCSETGYELPGGGAVESPRSYTDVGATLLVVD